MRTAHILGRRHGSKTAELIGGIGAPIHEVKESFKEFLRSGSHENFCYVELWDSGHGVVKKRNLDKPKAADAQKQKKANSPKL